MANDKALRAQLADYLNWENAHVGFERALRGVPPRLRGKVPKGFAHSLWQLLEHMRIAQADILDFCVNPKYVHAMKWPDDYWPKRPAPPSGAAWTKAMARFEVDLRAMQRLAKNPRVNLFARIPQGTGQTYLREVLLIADHNAHHIGQMIDVRRALGIWK